MVAGFSASAHRKTLRISTANRMGTPADVARMFERLTDNLVAVSTQQANIVERLEDWKSGLELVASNLESSQSLVQTQQAAASRQLRTNNWLHHLHEHYLQA